MQHLDRGLVEGKGKERKRKPYENKMKWLELNLLVFIELEMGRE